MTDPNLTRQVPAPLTDAQYMEMKDGLAAGAYTAPAESAQALRIENFRLSGLPPVIGEAVTDEVYVDFRKVLAGIKAAHRQS